METKNILLEGVTHQPRHSRLTYTWGSVTHTFGGNVVETPHDIPAPDTPTPEHEYVEIAGIKWATMNVGATSETDYGLYFQWGDTQGYTADQVGEGEGKKAFGDADYKYRSQGSLSKYNGTDGKTVLDLEDDAARANMGGEWRIPTTEELQALGEAVNAVWTTDYNGSGVNGFLCTDKTDNTKTLFFPAAGFAYNGSMRGVGFGGYVWASSLSNGSVTYAYNSILDTEGAEWDTTLNRSNGLSVRGVLDSSPYFKLKYSFGSMEELIKYIEDYHAAGEDKVTRLLKQEYDLGNIDDWQYEEALLNVSIPDDYFLDGKLISYNIEESDNGIEVIVSNVGVIVYNGGCDIKHWEFS